jgi:ketosteroid isomerase-like protein
MSRAALWPTAVICIVLGAGGTVGGQPVRSDHETLIQLERDWHAAVLANDVDVVEGILADGFIATYDDGTRGDKKKELELVAAFDQQIDASSLDEFLIQVHGDTAVVHFTLRLVGPVQGVPMELALRYIDVWVYQKGRWQCVASQSTRVRSKG